MNNIKYYQLVTFIFMSLALNLFSCSDDLEVNTSTVPDGVLQLEIGVPEPIKVNTKTTDKDINDLTVFIFSEDGNTLYDSKEFENVTSGDKINIELNSTARNNNRVLYAVANAKNKLTGITKIEDIEKISLTDVISLDNGLVMSGKTDVIAKNAVSASLDLSRIVAKVSVTFGNGVAGYSYNGFSIEKGRDRGYIGSPTTSNDSYKFNETGEKQSITVSSDVSEVFLYPAKGALSGDKDPAYLIIQAKRESDSYNSFYRLDLINSENKNKLDILPNHEYKVTITSIDGPGYSTKDEAAKYPSNGDIKYYITDHSVNVLSMVSDGLRELGVQSVINNFTYPDPEFTTTLEGSFIVRLSCIEEGDEPWSHYPAISFGNLTNKKNHTVGETYKVEIIEGSNWITLTKVEDLTNTSTESGIGGANEETTGKRYKYTIQIVPEDGAGGEMTGIIRVTWMGLTRDVKLLYTTEFEPSKFCNATLTIKKSEKTIDQVSIAGYWNFINGKGTSEGEKQQGNSAATLYAIPRLFGIQHKNEMAENRMQGFHFPVCYGDDYLWEYEYKVDFSPKYSYNNQIIKIDAEITGDPYLVQNVEWEYYPQDYYFGYLKLKGGKDSYHYATGTVTFTLTYNNGDPLIVSFDLYHTGFFHYDESAIDRGYYYYEVVEMENGQHWLDRNLRAKSNGIYIQDDNGNSIFNGSEGYPFSSGDANGEYVKIADYKAYSDPDLDPNKICPPGYRIPTKSEFDKIRTSTFFHTEEKRTSTVSYYASYYENKYGREIYFPKGRFLNNDEKAGDGNSGYYWTQTSSSGVEKEQIGNWLNVLYLNGQSSSYINGNVTKHKMSLRCIAGNGRVQETNYTIGFKVRGATGVYLYSQNGDNRSGVFSFPGKAIGDFETMKSYNGETDEDKSMQFSYISTVPASQLYVYFTCTDENGKIWIISRDGKYEYSNGDYPLGHGITDSAKLDAASSANIDLNNVKGWPVWLDYNYFFTWDSDYGKLTDTHIFQSGSIDVTNEKFRLYWPRTKGSGIHILQGNEKLTGDLGTANGTPDSNDSYYYKDFEVVTGSKIKIKFTSSDTNAFLEYALNAFEEVDFSGDKRNCAYFTEMSSKNSKLNKGIPSGPYNPTNIEAYDIVRFKWKTNINGSGYPYLNMCINGVWYNLKHEEVLEDNKYYYLDFVMPNSLSGNIILEPNDKYTYTDKRDHSFTDAEIIVSGDSRYWQITH
ncbi:MAG: hypothetical protein J1F12_08785 [Muribaculaceae bacterium]|nr:hypothetical protein [Muribaculaceae bacterium]